MILLYDYSGRVRTIGSGKGDHGSSDDPGDRHRRGPAHLRAGAGVPRPAGSAAPPPPREACAILLQEVRADRDGHPPRIGEL